MRWVAARAWTAAAVYAFWAWRPALWLPVIFLVAAGLIAVGGTTGRLAAGAAAIFAAIIGIQLVVWLIGCALLCPSWIALVGTAGLVLISGLASGTTAEDTGGIGH